MKKYKKHIIYLLSLLCVIGLVGCKKTPESEVVENTGSMAPGHVHSYSLSYSTSATCKEEGKVVTKCKCGDTLTEVLPLADHTWTTSTQTKATCSAVGKQLKKCTVCKVSVTEDIPMLNHKYEYTKRTQATCAEEGIVEKTCKTCKNVETEVVPKLAHIFYSADEQPTCEKDGVKREKCVSCGETKDKEIIKSLGHDYQVTKKVDPTCQYAGFEEKACTRCNQETKTILEVIEHDFIKENLTAGCEADGYNKTFCKFCGEVKEEEILPAIGHNYKNVAIIPASCTAAGEIERQCTNCHDVDVESVPMIDHDFIVETTNPTCVQNGHVTEKCKVCGTIKSKETIPALTHDYKVIAEFSATCEAEGKVQKSCQRCQDQATEKIPKRGHELFDYVAQDSTCQKEGVLHKNCLLCKKTIEQQAIPKKNHSYELVEDTNEYQKWECSVCKSSKTENKAN